MTQVTAVESENKSLSVKTDQQVKTFDAWIAWFHKEIGKLEQKIDQFCDDVKKTAEQAKQKADQFVDETGKKVKQFADDTATKIRGWEERVKHWIHPETA